MTLLAGTADCPRHIALPILSMAIGGRAHPPRLPGVGRSCGASVRAPDSPRAFEYHGRTGAGVVAGQWPDKGGEGMTQTVDAEMRAAASPATDTRASAMSQAEFGTLLCDVLPRQGCWSDEGYLWLTDHGRRRIEFTDGFI